MAGSFDIFITRGGDKTYNVLVANSPEGSLDPVTVTIDVQDPEIAPALDQIRAKQRVPSLDDLRALGEWLTRRLLPDEVWDLYQRCQASEHLPLLIRLNLPTELSGLPWEYAWDRNAKNFLLLSDVVQLARRPNRMGAAHVPEVEGPIKMLLVIASPTEGAAKIDVLDELDGLYDALQPLLDGGALSVDVMFGGSDAERQQIAARAQTWEGVTLLNAPLNAEAMILALRREVHIFHYLGHGKSDRQGGALLLTYEDGRAAPFETSRLRDVVSGRSLALVYLNACETATPTADSDLVSAANALIDAGVPAVVAMQYEIPSRLAGVFARAFYQAIAEEMPAHLAVADARRVVKAAPPARGESVSVAWGIPVLYLCAKNDIVLKKKGEAGAAPHRERFGVHAEGDYVAGDKVGGDKVAGDKYTVQGDYLRDHARKIDTGGGPYVEGGGIAAGGDLNIDEGAQVAGRDSIHIGGDVGPGAAIGSGASVRAHNIAGGDIIGGEPAGPGLARLATPDEIDLLRLELDALRKKAARIADERTRRRAEDRLSRLEAALSLGDPRGPVNAGRLRRTAVWLIEHAPALAEDLRDFLDMDVVRRILKA
ncbi:MAG: hypothetical protein Kow00120_04210 [Anaerolineae bacterium]